MNEIEIAIGRLKHHRDSIYVVQIDDGSCDLAISALEKQLNNGWISVVDRLPIKEDEILHVMLVTDGEYQWMAYYTPDDEWIFAECTNSNRKIDWDEIIAWQHLPDTFITTK